MNEIDLRKWISTEIKDLVRAEVEDRTNCSGIEDMFSVPLIGFVSGDDPIFLELRSVIGDFHLSPRDLLSSVASTKGKRLESSDPVGIISYVLPIAEGTREENASMKDFPSERWSRTRLFGERINHRIQAKMVDVLTERGYIAAAPELEPSSYRTLIDERVGRASTWSQRHVAYAAGLGTFGLSDGLITSAGVAHRLGSVVANVDLTSPNRTADIHRDCLFFGEGKCMVCARRCPAGAISPNGHDKSKCAEFVFGSRAGANERYGIDIYACGLCQTGVPCERCIPKKGKSHFETLADELL